MATYSNENRINNGIQGIDLTNYAGKTYLVMSERYVYGQWGTPRRWYWHALPHGPLKLAILAAYRNGGL